MARDDYSLPNSAPPEPERRPRKKPASLLSSLDTGLPANIDAEKTILGAILLDNEAWYTVEEKIRPDDFSLDNHRRIYIRMKDIFDAKRNVDIVTLSHELTRNKEIEAVGGVAYLASLTEGLPIRPQIDNYIEILKDKAVLRGLMLLSNSTIIRAADQSDSGLEIANWTAEQLEEVVSGGIHKGLEPVASVTVGVTDRYLIQCQLTSSPGLSFGVSAIDEATGGIQKGEQVVVGCFSGVGKTTLLAQIVAANCSKGFGAAMFLIEPTKDSFLRQLYTIVAGVRYVAATKPWMATMEEKEKIIAASREVAEWPLFLHDNSKLTLGEMIPLARLAVKRHKVNIIGLDYLQRLKVKSVDKNEDTRLRIGRASTELADLVKDTGTSSVVLSQLGRSGGMEALPTMDRLRESGQIENDAATILLMHLKWDAEQGHFTSDGAGIIPKQRFGVPCNVGLHKDPHTALWCSGSKESAAREVEVKKQQDLHWNQVA